MKSTESELRNVLACYPWREYRYKYGRWQHRAALLDLGSQRYKWAKTYDTFQLVEPETGRAVGEFLADGVRLAKYDGTVCFAGDPDIAGVCSPTPDDAAPNWLVISAFADKRAATEQVTQLRPGATMWLPSGPTGRLDDSSHAPWVADHPDKP
ncbi:MAG TPA: hypothetical protein VHZ97_31090 [Pseudonocardiaceae bacterium]|nr:hypothetical protein [Pseudonocardiaceae bacterium]